MTKKITSFRRRIALPACGVVKLFRLKRGAGRSPFKEKTLMTSTGLTYTTIAIRPCTSTGNQSTTSASSRHISCIEVSGR